MSECWFCGEDANNYCEDCDRAYCDECPCDCRDGVDIGSIEDHYKGDR
jgi:hypothetical protein